MVVYGITGGCGYVGFRLALALLRQQPLARCRLLDVRALDERTNGPCHSLYHSIDISDNDNGGDTRYQHSPSLFPQCYHALTDDERSRLSYHRCDLCSDISVMTALTGVDMVMHVASYGMSGIEMMRVTMINEVNVNGTRRVVDACLKHNIAQLIYVSTYNVVFGNQTLVNATEATPYFPLAEHSDDYSISKSRAEQLVLGSAGQSLANGKRLRVIVIRPAAIYGDGEERHLPRILTLAQRGISLFSIGSSSILCDWLYVDNLVHGLVLASKLANSWLQLLQSPVSAVYALSDAEPVNNFEFLGRIIRGLGYERIFLLQIPTIVMLKFAHLAEMIYSLLSSIGVTLVPFLTRAEVLKVGVTHFMDVTAARKELGWRVVVSQNEAVRRCIEYYTRAGFHAYQQTPASSNATRWLVPALAMLAVLIILLSTVWK